MDITETVYVATRAEWRAWLHEHHATKDEIWLVLHRKATGIRSVPYNDAVEEALCVGWIDGLRKALDETRLAHRYTPRKPTSGYSQTNKERLRRLIPAGQVLPEVAASVAEVLAKPFAFPDDIRTALQAEPQVWANFQRYSDAYQRIRIAFVDTARRRPGEYEKRLAHLIKMTAQDKQFGYHIETYY